MAQARAPAAPMPTWGKEPSWQRDPGQAPGALSLMPWGRVPIEGSHGDRDDPWVAAMLRACKAHTFSYKPQPLCPRSKAGLRGMGCT